MKIKDIFILCTTTIILFITGCLEMEVVDQPGGVEVGSTFSSHAMVEFRKDGSIGDDDDRAMLFAVNKPSGWTINSITYVSPEHGSGVFNYLGNDADEDETGGIDTGWEDSIEAFQPSSENMHWQMYLSDKDTTSTSTDTDPDSFHVMVHYTVDNTVATYDLYYYTTHTNNNDHTDQSKADWDNATTSVYDPSVPVYLTLQVDMSDQTVSPDGVHVAGSFGAEGDATWWKSFCIRCEHHRKLD